MPAARNSSSAQVSSSLSSGGTGASHSAAPARQLYGLVCQYTYPVRLKIFSSFLSFPSAQPTLAYNCAACFSCQLLPSWLHQPALAGQNRLVHRDQRLRSPRAVRPRNSCVPGVGSSKGTGSRSQERSSGVTSSKPGQPRSKVAPACMAPWPNPRRGLFKPQGQHPQALP